MPPTNYLEGGRLGDVLSGKEGSDIIEVGFVQAEGAIDTVFGGQGSDFFPAGDGKTDFTGGSGVDTVSYEFASSSVVANLVTDTAVVTARVGPTMTYSDRLTAVENVTGSRYDDSLTGDGAPNTLIAAGGAGDVLAGGGGTDVLDALEVGSIARGPDDIDGGADADTCRTDSGDTRINCES